MVDAKVLPAEGKQPARLRLTATIQDGWHTFSITQPPGGPIKTKIKVEPQAGLKVGLFKTITPPDRHQDPAFDNATVEEHSGTAVWEAPLAIEPALEPGDLRIAGAVRAQACKTSCIPPTNYKFETTLDAEARAAVANAAAYAAFQSDAELPTPGTVVSARSEHASSNDQPSERQAAELWPDATPEYRGPGSHLTLRGQVTPAVAAPGGKIRLLLSATPEPPFHAYALAAEDNGTIGRGKPTLIKLLSTPGFTFSRPEATTPSISNPGPDAPMNVDRYYSGAVDFSLEATIDRDAAPGKHAIEGVVSYQTCTLGKKDDAQCDVSAGAIPGDGRGVGGRAER